MSDNIIDLETLGLEPNAIIVSVGMCKIDLDLGNIIDTSYMVLNRQQQVDRGRTITSSTVDWWLGQPEEARKVFTDPMIDIDEALYRIRLFIGPEDYVWGNGATLDLTILGTLFGPRDSTPWKYWNEQDIRTIFRCAENVYDKHTHEFEGVKHNALADATNEAISLSKAWRALKK